MTPTLPPTSAGESEALQRYLAAQGTLEASRTEVTELEHATEVEEFHQQMELLRRRLLAEPTAFRQMFISDGMAAVAWEFSQPDLGKEFTETLWGLLSRGDDVSVMFMRFMWNLPLGKKRMFIRAIDTHLSDRYPMFAGLSKGWPASVSIPPYIRDPESRSKDFGLVNQGYLGYMNLGFTRADVDLFIWLEALRDKQCAEKPCELGIFLAEHKEPKGGCPVKIHIPDMLELVGNGRFHEALELIEGANPLPGVTGRVCPQELQCQGVCLHKENPIQIGQVEWFLPEREKLVNPEGIAAAFADRPSPVGPGRQAARRDRRFRARPA